MKAFFNVRIVVTPLSQISSPAAKFKSKDAFTGSVTVFQLRHRPVRSLTLQVHIKLLETMPVYECMYGGKQRLSGFQL